MPVTNLNQYYQSIGQKLPSVSERAPIYESNGLGSAKSYLGTSAQNSALLTKLLAGSSSNTAGSPTAAPAAPSTPNDYLNSVQTSAYNTSGTPTATDVNQYLSAVTPSDIQKPALLNRVDLLKSLSSSNHVDELQSQLNDLKAQARQIQTDSQTRTHIEQGKPVAENVISGRVGQVVQQQNDKLATVNNQMMAVSDQLNTAMNVVNTIMQATSADYQDAITQYNTELQTRMTAYGQIQTQMNQQQQLASANAQIFYNAITKGDVNFDQLSPADKANLSAMSTKAGLGTNFFQNVQANYKGNVLNVSTRVDSAGNKYADTLIQGTGGKITVQSVYLGKEHIAATGASTSAANAAALKSNLQQANQAFQSATGNDGYVSATAYKTLKSKWLDQGYSPAEFDSQFYGFINPATFTNQGWESYGVGAGTYNKLAGTSY